MNTNTSPTPSPALPGARAPAEPKHVIYVILDGGLVREVLDVPAGIEVHVIDYDTQGADPQDLDQSPFNGTPCCRATYP